ncbi:type II toxin-antitoxin system Phd/YefM family antitoxin (plasmid) [Paenibacillus peoriae]|uniref:Antitoxin n=1 Tax=Paenibacillus peoriae TaxID=59893 RepID=A0A7H0YH42_9BACL|nr:type II toxin-antitoxin system Phd/YefM family antitoxin [Paenibacillus peoriae]QNR70400.1 type II toxin-antitoxin system Phd/YefM family antitoxin [Paenibacillus peoriae]
MPKIIPVSELRNNFADISKQVHETNEVIMLTKNGYGDMVLMSMDTYEKLMVNFKLRESELEAATSAKRLSHDEVMQNLRKQ